MGRIQTIERTGKFWKLTTAIGFLGICVGLALYFMAGENVALQRVGGVAAGASVPVWLFGRVGAWLFHG